MKKTPKSKHDLNQFSGSLNFAFCPMKALIAAKKLTMETDEVQSIIKDYPTVDTDNLLNAFRYFYICYSIKIDNIEQENKDYFYFQLFSQMGEEQVATSPIYGFYNHDQIISMIKDIDAMFDPERHERQIFESYTENLSGESGELIKLMQEWTSLKLLQFNDLYFQDEGAVYSLYKLMEDAKKSEIKTKSKTAAKNKIKKPTTKKQTNKKTLNKK